MDIAPKIAIKTTRLVLLKTVAIVAIAIIDFNSSYVLYRQGDDFEVHVVDYQKKTLSLFKRFLKL
jgi:hypothetical protein